MRTNARTQQLAAEADSEEEEKHVPCTSVSSSTSIFSTRSLLISLVSQHTVLNACTYRHILTTGEKW